MDIRLTHVAVAPHLMVSEELALLKRDQTAAIDSFFRRGRQLLIADAGIADGEVLLDHLRPDIDLWRVTADDNPLEMLRKALLHGYEQLHFLGHGKPGSITLGGRSLGHADFTRHAPDEATKMVAVPSFHFWSCLTGSGAKGRQFVDRITRAYGSAVTAFSTLVGAESLGGCWAPDVMSSGVDSISVPFGSVHLYPYTLQDSVLELKNVDTATGVDVQVWLKAGTVTNNFGVVLTYDAALATAALAIDPDYTPDYTPNPAIKTWSLMYNPYTSGIVRLTAFAFSKPAISSSTDLLLDTISFTGGNSEGCSTAIVWNTNFYNDDSPVSLGALPVLCNLKETDAVLSASGTLVTSSSVTAAHTFVPQATVPGSSGYGLFTISSTGWSYTANSAHNEFVQGAVYTDTITAVTVDGLTSERIAVSMTGTNDAPTVSVAESSITNNGADPYHLDLLLHASDSEGDMLNVSNIVCSVDGVPTGNSGLDLPSGFTLSGTTLTVDPSNTAYSDIPVHGSSTIVLSYSITDSYGASVQQMETVTIVKKSQPATFSGMDMASVTEDSGSSVESGTLVVSDVDSPATVIAQTGVAGSYGSFSIDADGLWSYTADNSKLQTLGGTTLTATESFTITTVDSTTHNIEVTLTGVNDAATFSGSDTASVTEDSGSYVKSGTLVVSDVDSPATVIAQTGVEGSYGSFSIDAGGHWSYTADNTRLQPLGGITLTATESFMITTADSTTHNIEVTLTGVNDAATFSGTDTASVTEDSGSYVKSGTLIVSDVDSPATVTAQTGFAGSYGSFSIDAGGNWVYTADNSKLQVFGGTTPTATESFTVTTAGGTTHAVKVSFIGQNDLPTGGVTIAGEAMQGATLTAANTLADADGLGGISYQWQAAGVDIAGANGNSLIVGQSEVGKTITVKANYTDVGGVHESVSSQPTATVTLVPGVAQDGYLAHALVWTDTDNDGVRDWNDLNGNSSYDASEGESWTLTDSNGRFSGLTGSGTLRLTANPAGGTVDISTGKPFTGSYSAPAGSSVVNPLTTLLGSVGSSASIVATAFGLDPALDFTTYDPLAGLSTTGTANDAMALKVQSTALQIATLMEITAKAIEAGGAGSTTTTDIAKNVADKLISLATATSNPLNLTDNTVVADVILSAATTLDPGTVTTSNANAIATAVCQVTSSILNASTGVANVSDSLVRMVSAQMFAQTTLAEQVVQVVLQHNNTLITTDAATINQQILDKESGVGQLFVPIAGQTQLNHAPDGAVTITGTATQGQTLAAHNTLVDVDGLGAISYLWSADGVAISGAAGSSYTLQPSDVGKNISVTASYTDQLGTPESMNSASTPDVAFVTTGSDPYAGDHGGSGGGAGVILAGVGGLGLLAWLIL